MEAFIFVVIVIALLLFFAGLFLYPVTLLIRFLRLGCKAFEKYLNDAYVYLPEDEDDD